MSPATSSPPRAATGIPGLDHILGGGWPRNRLFLVEGDPGTGKTTLALQFLLEGARRGEPGLYITLSETAEELRAVAASHGWSLDGLALHELAVPEDSLDPDTQYTLFHPSEVELGETTKLVLAEVDRVQPQRVVFDSLSEMRLLARDPLRYRRQILALKQYFVGRQCTVLLLDDRTSGGGDKQLHSLVHGVATLEQLTPVYGAGRRRLRVSKLRGVRFQDGYHDFGIVRGGLVVCPRLVAAEHRTPFAREAVSSGVPDLDALLGGGLDRGTSTLVLGAAGVGKSSLVLQFVLAAAGRDEHAALYTFDEGTGTLFARAAGLGLDLHGHADAGRVHVQQIDPAEMSPGEFAHLVRKAVEDGQTRMVVLDSLNGYLNAMPEDRFLAAHLHELLTYLGQRGVVTLLIVAQHGLVGGGMETPVDVSYLADTVILLRYFETAGAVRQAISVLKKRSGGHERTIREFRVGPRGVQVGAPLKEFHGVLTGVPTYRGPTPPPLGDGNADA
jgi:circadian clock protein KaiC